MIPMTFLIQILNMSLGAAWAALLVIAFRVILRRLPKKYSYALWGVVLFRLVCPISFSSVVSLMPQPQTIPQGIIYAETPQVESGFAFFDQAVNEALPAVPPPVSAPAVSAAPAVPQAGVSPVQLWLEVGKFLWLAGMAVLLLWFAVCWLRFLGRLRGAVRLEGQGRTSVWESDRVPTAFVLGLTRPRIYLPSGLGEREKRLVLCHEQAHIRRLDHIVKPVSLLLLTVHWFNPVLWLAWFLMRRDMEMSCDELAMETLGPSVRKEYSACLLSLSARQSGLAIPLAFGENDVKGRILNVLRYKKPAFWASVLAVILVAVLGFCLLANPGENSGTVIPDPGPSGVSGITLADLGNPGDGPSQQNAVQGRSAPEPEENANGLVTYCAPVRQGASYQNSGQLLETGSYIGATEVQYNVIKGTPVYSPIRGTVDEIQADILWPYGRWVSVRSSENSGVTILLSHLGAVEEGLKVGDAVDTATQLGLSGSSGNITGAGVGVTIRKKDAVTYDDENGILGPSDWWGQVLENFPDCLSDYLGSSYDPAQDNTPRISYTAPIRGDHLKTSYVPAKLDYQVDHGTPVYSPIHGIVDEIVSISVWPYGKQVIVRSDQNPTITVLIGHLDSIAEELAVGDEVDSAAQIGTAGITGNTPVPVACVTVRKQFDDHIGEVRLEQWDTIFDNWQGDVPDGPLDEYQIRY